MSRRLFSLRACLVGIALCALPALAVNSPSPAESGLSAVRTGALLRLDTSKPTPREHAQAAADPTDFANTKGEILIESPVDSETVRFWEGLEPLANPSDHDAYLEATEEMAEHLNYGYGIHLFSVPEPIPLNRLSSARRESDATWYGPAILQVRPSRGGLEFYHRTVAPALHRFYGALALSKATTETTYRIKQDRNGMIRLSVKGSGPERQMAKRGQYTVLVPEASDITPILNPKDGGTFNIRYTAYYLPENFKPVTRRMDLQCYEFLENGNKLDVDHTEIHKWKANPMWAGSQASMYSLFTTSNLQLGWAFKTADCPVRQAQHPRLKLSFRDELAAKPIDMPSPSAEPVAPTPGSTEPVAPAPGSAEPVAPAPGSTEPVTPAPGAEQQDLFPGEELAFDEKATGPILGEAGSVVINRQVTAEEKAFWEGFTPLADKQDVAGFREAVLSIERNLVPGFRVILRQTSAPIPFEQLTAKQAGRGKNWFGPSIIEVSESAEWFDYYHKTIAPALHRFFEPLAIGRAAAEAQFKLEGDGNGGFKMRVLRSPIPQLVKDGTVSYIVSEIAEPEKLLRPQDGDVVTFRYYSYQLPRAFGLDGSKKVTQTVYCVIEDGERVSSEAFSWSNLVFEAGNNWWTIGPHSIPTLSVRYQTSPFRAETPEQLKVSFSLQKPQDTPTGGGEGSGSEGNLFFLVLLVILISSVLSLPYMIWVLVTEKRRAHVPLPLPEGMTEDDVKPEEVAPECQKIRDFYDHLSTFEYNGEERAFITRKREVDTGYAILRKLGELKDMSPSTRYRINQFGQELNAAQERVFNGNMKIPYLGSALTLLVFGPAIFLAPTVSAILVSIIWVFMTAVYFLSMKCPNYKLLNEEPGYYRFFVAVLIGVGIASVKTAVDMASSKYATVYRDRWGNAYISRDEQSTGCFLAALLIAFIVFMAPFFFMSFALCHFYRNYIASK